jgi:hypothetical protein
MALKAKICGVHRKRPNYTIGLLVSWGGGGASGYFLINLQTLQFLIKSLGAKNLKDLSDKTFDTEEWCPEKALRGFLQKHYPDAEGIEISSYTNKRPKYTPAVWKIISVHPDTKHFILGREEKYWVIRVEGHPKGCVLPVAVGPAYLREKAFGLLMEHFGVSEPKDLVDKEFRVNVDFEDPQAALLIVAMKDKYPELI